MKFIITVDTEADDQWKKGENISLKNIDYLPKFQALCDGYNFIPTYLLSYEIAADKHSIELLSKWQQEGKAEIGSHLHPWTCPPAAGDGQDKQTHGYPSELTDEEVERKLINLTEIIEKNFNQRPVSYRAGRWGIDQRQYDILTELGYLADCSITPKVSWKNHLGKSKAGGPDFRLFTSEPYRVNDKLLEVPVTILFTGVLNKENSLSAKIFLGLTESFFKRAVNKLFFKQKWLRIFPNSRRGDWQKIYQSAVKNNFPVLEFMIHSSELMPGGSPYAKNESAVNLIYEQLEFMFKFLKSRNVEGVSLGNFTREYPGLK